MNMSYSSQKKYSDDLFYTEKEEKSFSIASNTIEKNDTAKLNLIKNTFEKPFDKSQFSIFIRNLLNTFDERSSNIPISNSQSPVDKLECIGKYKNSDKKIDILIASLKNESSLEKARTSQRNCISNYLEKDINKDAALVAFIHPKKEDWRFSFVKIDYKFDNGKVIKEKTPSRCSFLVGKNETSHTAQSMFFPLLKEDNKNPDLSDLEKSFSVEKVTDKFYKQYRELFQSLKKSLDDTIKENKYIKNDFEKKAINSSDFSKKLLGQIVFLYFIQKKGWFGVKKDRKWGTGSKNFIRELFSESERKNKNFFNDVLEPLFYNALNKKEDYNDQFQCCIPFLNGGLFKPIGEYDWRNTDINLPNSLFSNKIKNKEGDTGNGILDIFERYNFTVNENEPLEKEIAIDPEMLGKVFENLLETKNRKSKGTYYTPREIVHYMCQESLINYLVEELKEKVEKKDIETLVKYGDLDKINEKTNFQAKLIDKKLRDIRICDPAVGSGAFPVGMMTEIVKIRNALSSRFLKNKKERTSYNFKRHAIEHCLYGVDIDSGAIEIAKLRLWLSLVVDDENHNNIQPLPNLNYKMIYSNSLLGDIYHRNKESTVRTKIVLELKKQKNLFARSLPKDNKNLLQKINNLKKQLWKNDINQKIKTIKEKISQSDLFINNKEYNKKLNQYKVKIEKLKNMKFTNHFEWHIDFSEVFQEKQGFDVVIANPPYVKEYINKSAFDGLRESPYYQGKMDIWYLFACKSIDISKPNSGVVTFIAQNNWVTSYGASKMRDKVIKESQILNLIDFGDFKIFSAGIQTMIMLFKNSSLSKQYTFDYRKLNGKSIEFKDMVSILKKEKNTNVEYINPEIDRNDLINKKLTFSNSEIENFIKKLSSKANFKLRNKEIAQGIVPNPDIITVSNLKKIPRKKIIENQIKKGFGVFVVKKFFFNGLNKYEKQSLKPLYEPTDLSKYYIKNKSNKDIIYLTKNTEPNKIPVLLNHLSKFKEIMNDRRENQSGRLKYYHLHWSRDEKFFKSGSKILSVRKCNYPTFTYTESMAYVMMSINVIKTNRIDQKYLTGILNSKLVAFWLKHKGKMQGSNYQIDKEPLLSIPIVQSTENMQKLLIEFVDKILEITKSEDYLQNSSKQKQVAEYEKQINLLVYKLYDLTPQEIKIIENS